MNYAGRVLPALVLTAALLAQQSDTSTFQASARLILVPFTVSRGKNLAADVRPSDVILREDGRPKNFTIFQGPNMGDALPLEMILLFDSWNYAAPKAQRLHSYWEVKAAYEFLDSRDERAMRAILETNRMDIQISAYHYADRQFERICKATRNADELLQGLRRLLDPIPSGEGILTLLPGSKDLSALKGGAALYSSAWTWESIVASLNEPASMSAGPVRRVLIVFSEGYRGTSSVDVRQNVADLALAMGVPIYPVILDRHKYEAHPSLLVNTPGKFATEAERRDPKSTIMYVPAPPASFLGDMTGGAAYFAESLDGKGIANILDGIRDSELAKYVVGFVPDRSEEPRKRKLEVALRSKSVGKVVGGRKDASY